MTMKRSPILAIAAFVPAAVIAAATALTPSTVMKSIAVSGARETLTRIYADNAQWTALLSGIATGSSEWLSVAKSLKPVSDAGSSEQITLALGEALEHEPEGVLALAGDGFDLSGICYGPDVDDGRYNSYELALAAIERRILRVKAVKRQPMLQSAAACVDSLNAAKAGIARFYGHVH